MPKLSEVENIDSRWSEDNSIKPEEISRTSRDSYKVLCLKCKQYSERKAKDIYKSPNRCGVCSGKIIIKGFNDALTHNPILKEVWDYERNELRPEDYSKTSGKKVWIKCITCKQSNLRQISNTVNNLNGCVVCSGKKVIHGINDLTLSSLMNDWYEGNTVDPKTITERSATLVQWICKEKHIYEMAPGTRTLLKQGCPYCAKQRTIVGKNDLATVFPSILEYWDYEKNIEIDLDPTKVSSRSQKKAWWICENDHSIFLPIAQKYDTKRNRPRICKDCLRGKQSYGEDELLKFLKNEGYKTDPSNKTILDGKEIDVYLTDLKIGFEFNGDYWHSNKVVYSKYGKTATEFHKEKLLKASEKGVRLYFIWASDWYRDTELMKDMVLKAIKGEEVDESLNILTKDSESNIDKSSFKIRQPKVNAVDKILNDENLIEEIKELAKDPLIKIYQAAEILKVSRTTLSRALIKLGITWESVNFKVIPKETLERTLKNTPLATVAEIRKKLDVSPSTLKKNLEYYKMNLQTYRNNRVCEHKFNEVICPYCNNKKVLEGLNDLKTLFPELAKEWDNAKNELSSNKVLAGSSTIIGEWLCSKCNKVWDKMTPSQRTKQKQNCPYCSNKRKKASSKSLGEEYPELICKWGDKNTLTIFKAYKRTLEYWWICEKGHQIKRTIYKQLSNGCSACSGHKIFKGSNDFKTVCEQEGRLDLLDQWDYKKNEEIKIKPNQITSKSNKKAWWICELEHSWFAQVGSRWDRGCPGCSRKRLEKGFNDLKTWCEKNTNFKHLLEEWDYQNNDKIGLKIDGVTSRASKRAFWKCLKCEYEWQTLISNRTAGNNCPKCSRRKAK